MKRRCILNLLLILGCVSLSEITWRTRAQDGSHIQANHQFTFFDEVLEWSNDGYLRDWKPGAGFPKSWTDPIDYQGGTVHIRVEVLTKANKTPTSILCRFTAGPHADRTQYLRFGAGMVVFSKPGVYYFQQPVVNARPLVAPGQFCWDAPVNLIQMVVSDASGQMVSQHERDLGTFARKQDDYFPLKARYTAFVVPKGETFVPPADWGEPTADPPASEQNWPRFRGADGGGYSRSATPPLIFDTNGAGVLWKAPVPLPGHNSPVVWGDRVFLSGGDKSKRSVFCFHATKGDLLWQQSVELPSPAGSQNWEVPEVAGMAPSTMALDGHRAYAIFANGDVAAFDVEGNKVWARNLGLPANQYGHTASLALWQGRLIVLMDQGDKEENKGRLYALDGPTGNILWEKPRSGVGSSWDSPIVIEAAGKPQILASSVPFAMAHSALDGSDLWRLDGLTGEMTPSPIYAAGLFFVVSPSDRLYAIKPDGQGDITKTHVAWIAEENVPDICSPVSNGELVFTLTTGGVLTCYDVHDGKKQWDRDLELEFQTSPAIAGSRLYLSNTKGKVVVVEAARQFKELARSDLAEPIYASPAFAQDRMYIRTVKTLFCLGGSQPTSTSATSREKTEQLRTERPAPVPRLRVSDNHRFLVTADGKPFFWLGDTAWELFHRLNREETGRYLADRAAKGFNVIQAVALAELDGLTVPNPKGHLPLLDKDLSRPDVKEGPDNDYWDDIEWTLRLAQQKGLYIGLLPMWGKYCPADTGNCERYGRFIGGRFKDHSNIIWILGGDRPAPTKREQDAWRAMARGIAIGVSGREDYDRVLMTYHTFGPDTSSKYFHEDSWLDFNGIQSSHGNAILNWKMIEHDYQLKPAKPVIDLETSYPGIGLNKMAPGNEHDARRSAYWAVFSGAFGHTSGNNSIWQMYAPGRKPLFGVKTFWSDTLDAPSAVQMGYLRKLIESRPFLTQEPDQSLLVNGPGDDLEHLAALRGDGCALIYTPTGKPFRVNLGKLTGKQVKAWWFDPRTGKVTAAGQYARDGERDFTPPGVPGAGNDWVLALDDPQRGFGPPRVALEPYDWRGFGGFDTFKWRGFLLANNRWGGGNGRIWFKEGEGNWSFWTEHSDDLDQGQVKSFPHAGIGWMWGNWAPNQALPIQLGELAVAKSDWTVTLPESEPNQSYVVYYQIYTSAVPDPKNDGNKISGDLAVIIHREDFPFEAWSKNLGEFDIGGRKWRVVQKASAIGKSTYIIMIPTAPLAKRERGRLIVENFDLKPCIDFCVAQGFYQPTDYLLTIQAGWESRGLHGCLRSDDLKLAVGRKGAEPIRLPLAPLAK